LPTADKKKTPNSQQPLSSKVKNGRPEIKVARKSRKRQRSLYFKSLNLNEETSEAQISASPEKKKQRSLRSDLEAPALGSKYDIFLSDLCECVDQTNCCCGAWYTAVVKKFDKKELGYVVSFDCDGTSRVIPWSPNSPIWKVFFFYFNFFFNFFFRKLRYNLLRKSSHLPALVVLIALDFLQLLVE
jgi:hypothetical protein